MSDVTKTDGFTFQVSVQGEVPIRVEQQCDISLSLIPPCTPPNWLEEDGQFSDQIELLVVLVADLKHLKIESGNRQKWIVPRTGIPSKLVCTIFARTPGLHKLTIDFFDSRTLILLEEYEITLEAVA